MVSLLSTTYNVANNKIGFIDIADGNNLENLVFKGDGPVSFNIDAEFLLPGVAFKLLNWGFAVTTAGHIKTSVVDFDPTVGDAFINGALNSITSGTTTISNANNQRITAATWGELGFSASHKIFENEKNNLTKLSERLYGKIDGEIDMDLHGNISIKTSNPANLNL